MDDERFKCMCCCEEQLGSYWSPLDFVICLPCYGKFFEPLECEIRHELLINLKKKPFPK